MSEVFGRTNTITIVDIVNGEVKDVQILKNPGVSFRFGVGPILVKTLADMNIDVTVASELGPSASGLIEDHKISKVIVKPGTPVKEAIKAIELQSS
ncbi:MAG: NifB/NifX family molybdenum-iron cluster-binding protein [Thermoproteota archaeon]